MSGYERGPAHGSTPTNTISPARLAAFEILLRVEEAGAYASVLLATKAGQLKPNDRAFAHELVMGVLRRQLWLDHLIAHYANRDPRRLDGAVRVALRIGLYQLRFMSRVPPSAAVNESVNLVRRARLRSAESFVNAVLRRATREVDYDPVTQIANPVEKLALETSHPLWLIQRWADHWGLEETAGFARANNEIAPTAFRVVNDPIHAPEILDALKSEGMVLSPSAITPGGWRISDSSPLLHQLAREGRIYIQDEASQLVAHILNPGAGERVLDVCAAPGSKTTHIAALSGGNSFIIAGDLHAHRLRTVAATAATQGFEDIHCVALDGSQQLPFVTEGFDRVLVDAPCTGTGTLRRNPEIRWRISAADSNAAAMVKPGGRLVYSTCSVEPEENEQVVSSFMQQSTDFKALVLPVNSALLTTSGAVRVWPHKVGADGFFIAAFERL